MKDTFRLSVGEELRDIVENNGFEISSAKSRLQERNERQIVTGIVVNRFPNVRRTYVRQIRAMLHAWRKYGHDAAEAEYFENYDKKHRGWFKKRPSFRQIVRGKIAFLGMVRGHDNPIYVRYWNQLLDLEPEIGTRIPDSSMSEDRRKALDPRLVKPLILTEGKTDWKHLKSALKKLHKRGRFRHLTVEFQEQEQNVGDTNLLRDLKSIAKLQDQRLTMFMFDRDNRRIVKQVSDSNNDVKRWSESVFSFVIPVPDHRQHTPEICIEQYYRNDDLKREDDNGRRLFLSDEFHDRSFRHMQDNLNCANRNIFNGPQPQIVDSQVYNERNENVALSKNEFAENILNESPNFKDVDISSFATIFEVIWKIVVEYAKGSDV